VPGAALLYVRNLRSFLNFKSNLLTSLSLTLQDFSSAIKAGLRIYLDLFTSCPNSVRRILSVDGKRGDCTKLFNTNPGRMLFPNLHTMNQSAVSPQFLIKQNILINFD
jgi:hypothetical protein